MQSDEKRRPGLRRRKQRGGDLIEFTMVLLPLLAFITVTMDASWGIFIKASLQYAVRSALRYGVTITNSQVPNGSSVTAMVKTAVQANSLGLLHSANGNFSSYIQVHYLQQSSTSSTGVVDVSNCTGVATPVASCTQAGNMPGNIMQVQIVNYPLNALTPRFFAWASGADFAKTNINAMSADEIEPSASVPPIGSAP